MVIEHAQMDGLILNTTRTPTQSTVRQSRILLGMGLAALAMFLFASQDAITKTLVQQMPISTVLVTRYTAFAIFATILAAWTMKGGLKAAVKTNNFLGQCFRGLILVGEIFVFSWGVRHLDMGLNHALFSVFPLVITAMAGPLLGEKVGIWRWSAVLIGFLGALIVIRPGFDIPSPYVIFPIIAACMYASYNIVTRMTGRSADSFQTSLFYLGVVGWIAILPFGIVQWQQPAGDQIWLLGLLCMTSIAGHSALIAALMFASASAIQPLNYLLLVFATAIGIVVFGESLELWTTIGASIIVASGLFIIVRERLNKSPDDKV